MHYSPDLQRLVGSALLVGDEVQRSNQLVDLRYRVVPGHAAVLMPEDVRDGVLTRISFSQPHSDRVPEIVHPQIGEVRVLLAGLAAPVLPGGVAHRLERT